MGATGAALADQSQIGLKLGVQPWTPVTNDDTVQFLLNDPKLVSDSLNKGWQDYSGLLEAAIKTKLSTPDLVADGVSFYDIDLHLTQPLVTVDQLEGSGIPGDPYHFAVHLDLKSEGVTMTATQPTVLGSYADPRCSAEFDATLTMQLTIENTPGAAFSSPQTQPGGEPVVQITRFDFDSNNLICDIPVDLISALGMKDALTKFLTAKDGVVNKPLGDAARGVLTGAITDLNKAVASYQRPELNLLILRAWLIDQPGGKTIVLNLAPRSPLPDPSAGQGSMTGTVTANGAAGIKVGGPSAKVACSSLPVTVQRITGPRPMTSAYGTLGALPLEALNVHADCDAHVLAPGQHSKYRITGMSALFPQIVTYGSVAGKCTSYEAGVRQGIDIKTAWLQGVILPQNLYSNYDLAATYNSIACGGQAVAVANVKDRFLKYLIDQQTQNPSETTRNVLTEYVKSRGYSNSIIQDLAKAKPAVPSIQGQQIRTQTAPIPADCTPNQYTDNAMTARAVQALNVRSGDSTHCKVIGQVPAGREVSVLSCTLDNGGPSSWCQIELGRTGPSFVAKRLLNFDAVATVDDSGLFDNQDTPPVTRGRGRPHGDVVLQFPADNSDMASDNGDTSNDNGDISTDNPPDGQRATPADMQTTQSTGGIDCNDPRLFNSRIRNLVCAAAQ
ncbi:MAG: SH3 domain-containing protein [Devosia sp.]